MTKGKLKEILLRELDGVGSFDLMLDVIVEFIAKNFRIRKGVPWNKKK